MRHEQGLETALPSGNTECFQPLRQLGGLVPTLQAFKRCNHFVASSQLRATRVRAKFPLTAEPHHDDACQYSQHHLSDQRGNHEGGPMLPLCFEYNPIHKMADDS